MYQNYFFSILLLLFLSTPLHSQSALPVEKQELIAETINNYPYQTQFALAFIDGEDVIYKGIIRKKAGAEWIDNKDSVFEIGSITKVFTSIIMADLAVEGKIDLEAPITEYLDFKLNQSEKDGQPILIRHLSNHTSGLPRMPSNMQEDMAKNPLNPFVAYDEEKLKAYLKDELKLESKPGENNTYSNLGAGLLGYILTKITGKTYEELLKRHIFKPLKMKRSTTHRAEVEKMLVKGRNLMGFITPNWDFDVLAPAGAIKSNAVDLVKFTKANMLRPTKGMKLTQQLTYDGKQLDWGLGWAFVKDKWYWHNGGTGGYRSSLAFDPETQKAVILLTNVSSGHPKAGAIDGFAFQLMD